MAHKEYFKSFSSFSAASEQRQCTRWSRWSNHLSWCGTPPQVLLDSDNDGCDFDWKGGGGQKYLVRKILHQEQEGAMGKWLQSLLRKTILNGISVWQGSIWRTPLLPFWTPPRMTEPATPNMCQAMFLQNDDIHFFLTKTVSMSSSNLDKWPHHC